MTDAKAARPHIHTGERIDQRRMRAAQTGLPRELLSPGSFPSAALWLLALATACGSDAGQPTSGPQSTSAEGQVTYVARTSDGAAPTDESLAALRSKSATAAPVVALLTPAPHAQLTRDEPPTFSWSSELVIGPGGAPRTTPPTRWALQRMGELLVGTAHAHGAAYSGNAYLLEVLAGSSADAKVSVLTPNTGHELDAEAWALVTSERVDEVRVRVYAAVFDKNQVIKGPFVSEEVAFTLTPPEPADGD